MRTFDWAQTQSLPAALLRQFGHAVRPVIPYMPHVFLDIPLMSGQKTPVAHRGGWYVDDVRMLAKHKRAYCRIAKKRFRVQRRFGDLLPVSVDHRHRPRSGPE
jgi:hypothetical protein